MPNFWRRLGIVTTLVVAISACAAPEPIVEQSASPPDRNLELVVTDLVAALIQVPSLNPSTTTLQMSEPNSDLGRVLLTALENAGYGLQLVDAEQGSSYVSYAVRTAETEAGIVNDYLISVDEIELRREYNTTETGIYPSSLLFVKGVENPDNIVLSEKMFTEQGGGQLFLSGVDPGRRGIRNPEQIREVFTDDTLRTNESSRLDQVEIFDQARDSTFAVAKEQQRKNLSGLSSYQRVVLMFPDNSELNLGAGNKVAVRKLLEKFVSGDVLDITACDDIDGRNEMAERRAIRVKEEFLSHGVPANAIRRAECTRTNYRHHSDDSPTPVTIVHYRAVTN